MAFSFNWAGLTIPQMNPIRDEVDLNAMGQALGKGLRGYRQRTAANEYADAIDRYRKGAYGDNVADSQRIRDIEDEIQRLRGENAQIDSMLGQASQQQQQQSVGPEEIAQEMKDFDTDAEAAEYARQAALFDGFDPKNPKAYTKDDIKAVQAFIGVPEADIDGIWGTQSQEYWDNFKNFTFI